MTGVPAEDIRATAREYATERHAAIFYTLGITEHACGVDNIWSLSNLVLMTGHLGYESTGLNALRGQNNVQGLNDSGANPVYLPGYQPVDDPEIRRKFSEAWGVEVPETPGYRLDQMMSGLHDGRIQALYLIGENPAQTEPNAHHVDEGLAKRRLHGLPGHLPERHDGEVRGRRSPGVELRREGRHVHEHRAADQPRPGRRRRCPARRRVDREIVIAHGEGARRALARVPGRRVGVERAGRPRARTGTAIRYDRLEENGIQWPCAEIGRPGHEVPPRAAPGTGRRTRQVLPRRVPAADRAARLGVPAHPLDRADALPLQLGDDDDARVGDHRQAGGSVLRDLRRGRVGARARRGRLGAARLATWRPAGARAITDRVYPGLVWMALHFAEAEGELAHARRRRPAHRHARVQGVAPSASSGRRERDARRRARHAAHPRSLREAVPLRAGVRVDAAAAPRLRAAGRRRRGHRPPDRRARAGTVAAGSRRAARPSSLSVLLHPPAQRHAPRALARRRARGRGGDRGGDRPHRADQVAERRDAEPAEGRRHPLRARRRRRRRRHRHQRQPDARASSPETRRRPRARSARSPARRTTRARLLGSLLFRLERIYDGWRHGGLDDLYGEVGARDFLRGRRITIDGKPATALQILRDGASRSRPATATARRA